MQVCSMSQKAQIHALLTEAANKEIIYITEDEEGLQYIMEEPYQQLKILVHALMSRQAHKLPSLLMYSLEILLLLP